MAKTNVYTEISEAKQKRTVMLADLREKLAKAEADKEKADAAAAEAIKNEKADAYTKAKADSRTAEDQIEYYQLQIKKYDKQPLFDDKETRKAKADEIRARVEEVKADKLKEAARLLKEANALVEATRAEILKANGALEDLMQNTGKKPAAISVILVSSLANTIRIGLEHTDIKPYV